MKVQKELSAEALCSYFDDVISELDGEIAYYRRKRKSGKVKATLLKILALLSAIGGVLLPLMGSLVDRLANGITAYFRMAPVDVTGTEAGYVALALGALLLLTDQVFIVTSGWARFMITELKLRTLRSNLEFGWASRLPRITGSTNSLEEAQAALEELRLARLQAHEIAEAETITWAGELDRAKSALANRMQEKS